MTPNEYVNREIELWGFEAIEELLAQGFEPVKLHTSDNREVWRWVQKPQMRENSPLTPAPLSAIR